MLVSVDFYSLLRTTIDIFDNFHFLLGILSIGVRAYVARLAIVAECGMRHSYECINGNANSY